jgi:mRNA interferase MazF
MTPARGQVYRCDVGFGLKPWLIVSNNARNRHTADVLAIGLTSTVRQLPTWVPLSSGDPLTGTPTPTTSRRSARTSSAITWAR